MYKIEQHQHQVKVVVCDRCGHSMSEDKPNGGYTNRTQIRFEAGYGSLFGDGNRIEGDLCDKCLYDVLGRYLRIVEPDTAQAREWGDDPSKPIEEFFEMQARRFYAPYQTPYQMVENVALILREWIDTCFDLKLKRTPVMAVPLVQLLTQQTKKYRRDGALTAIASAYALGRGAWVRNPPGAPSSSTCA